jgi:hypothetical protein
VNLVPITIRKKLVRFSRKFVSKKLNKIIKALLYPACVDCHEGMHAKERKQFHSLMETIHPIFYIKAQLTPGAA